MRRVGATRLRKSICERTYSMRAIAMLVVIFVLSACSQTATPSAERYYGGDGQYYPGLIPPKP